MQTLPSVEEILKARSVPMRIGVAEARACLGASLIASSPRVERIALADALDRRLAEDVQIAHALPPFANSAMDGYACKHASLAGASEPELRVVGESRAGARYQGGIGFGECVRISTGSALPVDADTVVIQENVERTGDALRVLKVPEPGAHVRQAGEECVAGARLLARFDILDARALALAASAGRIELRVLARPRVAIVTTGDELVVPGQPLAAGQIYDSNATLLQALVTEAGGQPLPPIQAAADDPVALLDVLRRAAGAADLVLTSGGASVGDHDHLPRLLLDHGSVHFWKVRMKPGMPALFGELHGKPLLALPGNPVSVFATFRVLARAALGALQGIAPIDPVRCRGRLAVPLRKARGRAEYVRALHRIDGDGQFWVRPLSGQESHRLVSLRQASVLLVLPEGEVDLAAGAMVDVEPLFELPENWP
jgi:molybdopterin molybdotransferase